MIDKLVIDAQDPEVRAEVKRGLIILAQTGIFKQQSDELFKRVALSAGSEEDDAEVLKEIRRAREESTLLLGLHNLGEEYAKEIES